ncbi:MAG: YCF48-related protein [candidate division KSB1 bacterium]|nr:YCF48-related protein [candidate division KSB1 bacterium]
MPLNSGLTDLHIQAIAIDPNRPATLYVSCYDGIFKSTNGGKSWQITNNGMTTNDIKALICHPQDGNVLYAATWGHGIFYSNDGGANWQQRNSGITDTRILSIQENKENVNSLYCISEAELLKSDDGGNNWQSLAIQLGKIRSLAVDFQANTLFLGTKYNGIYTSVDGGKSWEAAQSGLPKSSDGYYYAAGFMEMNHKESIVAWAAISSKGIYCSSDTGKTWHCESDMLNGITINCMAIATDNSEAIYVGTKQGVFITTDGAKTWEKMNDGLTTLDVRAIAIDPKDTRIIYAGTWDGGVFKYVRD